MKDTTIVTHCGRNPLGFIERIREYLIQEQDTNRVVVLRPSQRAFMAKAMKLAMLNQARDILAHRQTLVFIPPETIHYAPIVKDFYAQVESYATGKVLNSIRKCSPYLRRDDCLKRLAAGGFTVSKVFSVAEGVHKLNIPTYPAIIRRVAGHGGRGKLIKIDAKEDIRKVESPPDLVMSQAFIDTSKGGVFSKYRAVVIGDRAYPRQLQMSKYWEVRLKTSPVSHVARETAAKYVQGDEPNQEMLVEAVKYLGLDFACIDYSYFEGKPIIWEIFLPFAITQQYPTQEKALYKAFLKLFQGG